MAVPRARVLDLMKVQCELFSTIYNPEGKRLGNKILRQRLKGPSMAKYYPQKGPDLNWLAKEFKPFGLEVIDEQEMDRQDHLAGLKQRGKNAPKKKRGAPVVKGDGKKK